MKGMYESLNFFTIYFLEFKDGKTPVLLATDVAARGLGRFI